MGPKSKIDVLMSKLRQPIHINYISEYVLKEDLETTKKILDRYIEQGLIVESNIAKDYYVITKEKI
jgi:hypothetical protein